MVEVVEVFRMFHGERREARIVGRARTERGIARLVAKCALGNGWGVLLRGSASALAIAHAINYGPTEENGDA